MVSEYKRHGEKSGWEGVEYELVDAQVSFL
jgi:hypothetical protein